MPVVMTTAVGGVDATAVAATALRLRLLRFDAPAAQQAPVQTAMHMMTMHTPMQMNGTRTAIMMPTIIPLDMVLTAHVEESITIVSYIQTI